MQKMHGGVRGSDIDHVWNGQETDENRAYIKCQNIKIHPNIAAVTIN